MIETGANEAASSSKTREILVIGTDATIASHAYAAACRERGLRALEKACPLLVPLVEEGWVDHPVTAEVIRIYLTELLEQAQEEALDPDTLVLGCTHYPLLRPMMEAAVAPAIKVIDSAEATASQAARLLAGHRGLHGERVARDDAASSLPIRWPNSGAWALGFWAARLTRSNSWTWVADISLQRQDRSKQEWWI